MIQARTIAAASVAAALLAAGLVGCSQENKTPEPSAPALTAEQTAYGETPEQFRSSALAFKLAGRDCQLWKTQASEVIDALAPSGDTQLSVYISDIDYSTNVYTSIDEELPDDEDLEVGAEDDAEIDALLEDENVEQITEEEFEQMISDDDAHLGAYQLMEDSDDITQDVAASELASVEVPANSAVIVEPAAPGTYTFSVLAVNETSAAKTLDKCAVISIDLYSTTGDTAGMPEMAYGSASTASSAEEVLKALGQPYGESYDDVAPSLTYSYEGGSVSFSFAPDRSHAVSMSLSSAWAGEYEADVEEDAAFNEQLRKAEEKDWTSSEVAIGGHVVTIGQTALRELASWNIGMAAEGLDGEEDMGGTVTLGDSDACAVEYSLPAGAEKVVLGDCVVTGVYAVNPSLAGYEAEPEAAASEESLHLTVGGIGLGASKSEFANKFGRPSERNGDWLGYNRAAQVDGDEEDASAWMLEGMFSEGKLASLYFSLNG